MTASPGPTPVTARLLQLVGNWTPPDPEAAYGRAERAFADTLACALAATSDQAVLAASAALSSGSTIAYPAGLRYSIGDPGGAALLGGLAAHALDYDDVDDATISHPSAVLVPALLALGAQRDVTGADILDAYSVGLAAGRLLGSAIGIPGHYRAGWHSTATVGTVAAAVAAARLLRLTSGQTAHAIGVAGSLAAGSRQSFGTMTKPLHAGTAAANAVLAGTLASAGFTADPTQIEGPLGFLALHHGQQEQDHLATEAEMATPGLNVKLYPCCYYIHAAADAALELTADGLRAQDIRAVDVCVQPEGLTPLIRDRPVTGLQGKFSMQYAMAAVMLDGRLTLGTFTDEAVRRPEAQRLIPLVTPRTSATPPTGPAAWETGYAVVTVQTHDRRTLERRVDRPLGHTSRPVSDDQFRAKFDDCLRTGGFQVSDEAFATLRQLRHAASVRQTLTRLREALAVSASDEASGVGR